MLEESRDPEKEREPIRPKLVFSEGFNSNGHGNVTAPSEPKPEEPPAAVTPNLGTSTLLNDPTLGPVDPIEEA